MIGRDGTDHLGNLEEVVYQIDHIFSAKPDLLLFAGIRIAKS